MPQSSTDLAFSCAALRGQLWACDCLDSQRVRHLGDLFRWIVARVVRFCVSRIRGARERTMARNVLGVSYTPKAVVAITRLENHVHMAFFDINNEIGRGRMFHRVFLSHAWLKTAFGCV